MGFLDSIISFHKKYSGAEMLYGLFQDPPDVRNMKLEGVGDIGKSRPAFQYSDVEEKLPTIGIDIKGGEGRELSEFQNLSRNIFSAESEYRKLLQGLSDEQEAKVLNIRQEQSAANIRRAKADLLLQKQLSELGFQNTPTTSDIFFQSLMSGTGTGVGLSLQEKEQQQQFNSLFPNMGFGQQPGGFPNQQQLPQGQTPTFPTNNIFQGFG